MATKTTNYNLVKPTYDEDADIVIINKNMDIIDAKMKEIEEAGAGAQITVDSQLSETSTNPVQNKVISSKINELTSDLDELENCVVLGGNITNLKWSAGSLENTSVGNKPTVNTTYSTIRKYSFYNSKFNFTLTVSSGYTVVAYRLDANGIITSYIKDYTNVSENLSAGYYAFVFKENSDADISSIDGSQYANVTVNTKVNELEESIGALSDNLTQSVISLRNDIGITKLSYSQIIENMFIQSDGYPVSINSYHVAKYKVNGFQGLKLSLVGSQSDSAFCKFTSIDNLYASEIGDTFHTDSDDVVIPNDANYLFISYRKTFPADNIVVSFVNSDAFIMSLKSEEHFITVGSNKMFTDLIEAVNSITDSNAKNRYTIYLYEGRYNTIEEDKIGKTDSKTGLIYKGLVIPDYVSIVGIGNRDNIVINGELPIPSDNHIKYALDANTISTINFVANGTIENVTISAKNLRYCNHDDGINLSDSIVHSFRYVKFVMEDVTDSIWEASNHGVTCIPIGIGGQKNKEVIFERCIFENKCSGRWNIIIHDSSNGVNGCKLRITNCEFVSVGGGNDIVLSTNRTDSMKSFADIIGNILRRPILIQSLDSVIINNWMIFATGNANFSTQKGGGIANVDISNDIKSFGNFTN